MRGPLLLFFMAVALQANADEPDYTGPYRPQVHFSPPQNFMNDPNGLFLDAGGTYHLYYQYNPTGLVAGNQHWGHATSTDLYHWLNQPVAISPPTPDTQVFSGSAVIDVNNTSGFFSSQTNGVVAIYTLNTPRAQVQEIAYSLDGGYTFTRYANNPVINSTSTQFRDPKVIWHAETARWVMVIAFAQDLIIGIYTSPDLKAWTHASNFSHPNPVGLQYECPNLVRLPVRTAHSAEADRRIQHEHAYVLFISINPGAPLGGSITQYIPGTFNGTHFKPLATSPQLLPTDFAKDNYATQFFFLAEADANAHAGALSLAWASNWQYAESVPTSNEGWRSAMSLPRRTFLLKTSPETDTASDLELVFRPAHGLAPVLGALLARVRDLSAQERALEVDFAQVDSNAVYITARVDASHLPSAGRLLDGATLTFALQSHNTNESVSGGFSFKVAGSNTAPSALNTTASFFLDRSRTRGFNNSDFTGLFSTRVPTETIADGTWTFDVVFDRSLVEVFVNGGVRSATATLFPIEPLTLLTLQAEGMPAGAIVSAEVHGLVSGWTTGVEGSGGR